MSLSLNDSVNILARYLPGGPLFRKAFDSTSEFRKFLTGLARELHRANEYVDTFKYEFHPSRTTLFIEEWEKALGIPDDCFDTTGDIDTRRRNILIKLASLGVQTEQDFIDLAALFGVTVQIRNGNTNGIFPFEFPVILFDTPKEARFTIIVTYAVSAANKFPMTFPLMFGDESIAIMECLFSHLKPINCDLIFEQI